MDEDIVEREAIIRWLRAPTKGQLDWHRKMLADEIEAGEHLKGNSDGCPTPSACRFHKQCLRAVLNSTKENGNG